jgi:hypothetical protein
MRSRITVPAQIHLCAAAAGGRVRRRTMATGVTMRTLAKSPVRTMAVASLLVLYSSVGSGGAAAATGTAAPSAPLASMRGSASDGQDPSAALAQARRTGRAVPPRSPRVRTGC